MRDVEAQRENALVQGWLESAGLECELKSAPFQGVLGCPGPVLQTVAGQWQPVVKVAIALASEYILCSWAG